MDAKTKKLAEALTSWAKAKHAETGMLADVSVHTIDGFLCLTYDGAGYDCLSYAASYGAIYHDEVEALAAKHGFDFDYYSTWATMFYPA
jgi:hypothetical protein